MKKPTISKKIVAAVVALLAAIAGVYGFNVTQPIQDAAVEGACSTVVECQE
jgi:Mg2+ and Co2+ transporter CorA